MSEEMSEERLIEKYSGIYCKYQSSGNALADFGPLSKLNISAALALSAFVAQDSRYGLFLCVFYCLLAALCGRPREFLRVFLRLALVLGGVIVIVRQLSVHGDTVLFSLPGWRWTKEALDSGLDTAFTLLGFSGAILLFYTVTPMRDLMYALEQKGVSPAASYIMLSAFRTVADLNASARTIFESQRARGIETEGGPVTRARAFIPVLGPLMLGAISSAEEKYIAMDARAFSSGNRRAYLRELRPVPAWEKAFVIAADVCFALGCAAKLYTLFF